MLTARRDESESLAVLRRYVELSGNFLDTAEIYGPYKNEELVGRFLRENAARAGCCRDEVRLSHRKRGHTGSR